ncbi:MAG: DMT family transporter [Pseudomonadales bacterium]|nr:DMT family transporter [Pseudomonadales bacterium]
MFEVESWVWWTLLAALMQAVRTAGQKYLSQEISPLATTLVRYLYGLPFALIWLGILGQYTGFVFPEINLIFLLSGFAAGLLQIVATVLLIRLFTLRNFAIGTTYAKSEVLLTATIGFVFFSEKITWFASFAMIICVTGLVVITIVRVGGMTGLRSKSAIYGLGSGLCFALTSLFLRQASLSLEIPERGDFANMLTASMTLLYMVTLQTVVTTVLVVKMQPGELSRVFKAWRPALFVGFTGVVGSIGWFTAMTLEMASYVKTLGQVEFIMTLLIAVFYFHERPSMKELSGMVLILAGGMMLLVPGI